MAAITTHTLYGLVIIVVINVFMLPHLPYIYENMCSRFAIVRCSYTVYACLNEIKRWNSPVVMCLLGISNVYTFVLLNLAEPLSVRNAMQLFNAPSSLSRLNMQLNLTVTLCKVYMYTYMQ